VSPEQFTAIIVALTGLVGAIAALTYQVSRWHSQVNSRMDELLVLTAAAARAEGVASVPTSGSVPTGTHNP
jgi:uncharacterized membrane protein